MVKVKVCGMQSADDVAVCTAAGVDALGFIFADSPRRLTIAQAAALTQLVPPFVTKVAVFAGNSRAAVQAVLQACDFDLLQFGGSEPASFAGAFGKPTIIVLHAGNGSTAAAPGDLQLGRAAALMLDSRTPHRNGGTGIAVPLGLARAARERSRLPFILAGGLNPRNVAAAVAAVQPWAVDVRSGVERAGRKNAALVREFVMAAKGMTA